MCKEFPKHSLNLALGTHDGANGWFFEDLIGSRPIYSNTCLNFPQSIQKQVHGLPFQADFSAMSPCSWWLRMTLLLLPRHLELAFSPHFLLWYLWVGLHVHVCVWMCLSANVHVCTHVQSPEADIGCPSQLPSAFFTEGLLLSLAPIKSGSFWRASLPGNCLALLPEHGDYRCLPTCPAFM